MGGTVKAGVVLGSAPVFPVLKNSAFDSFEGGSPANLDSEMFQSSMPFSPLPLYAKASQAAASYYGLSVAANPLFVHWTSNPAGFQAARASRGNTVIALSMVVALLSYAAIAGAVLVLEQKRVRAELAAGIL